MKDIKIITLGRFGGRICDTLLSHGIDSKNLLHFAVWKEEFNHVAIENKYLLESIQGLSPGPFVDPQLYEKNLDLFERTIDSDSYYILFCGLGGVTASYLIVNLSKLLAERGKKFTMVVTIPHEFEGKRKITKAYNSLHELVTLANENVIPLSLDVMPPLAKGLQEYFMFVDHAVAMVIKGILKRFEVIQ